MDSTSEYQSTYSTSLKNEQTTFYSESFITKPNSYLYNLDEDDEGLLNRAKRDTTPFVCKGKIHY